ncbi:uncharacterized protein RJT20DRAFT_43684 [Scheffersomyces xylosifermentans]|uniref:uncharacterized protein n=1 Tax=Scheffersomyces xylosifermentans TaxID=1304137 RepID=UPI00315DF3FB
MTSTDPIPPKETDLEKYDEDDEVDPLTTLSESESNKQPVSIDDPAVGKLKPSPIAQPDSAPLAEAYASSDNNRPYHHNNIGSVCSTSTHLTTGNPITYAYNNYDHYHHKIHKFIKRTFHRLYYPGQGSAAVPSPVKDGNESTHVSSTPMATSKDASSSTSSSYIFERSLEGNASRSILNNPETPSHYNLENYTSPILDTTTEMLSNPNLDFYNDVKLNCFCEEDCKEDHSGEPRPRSRSIISISLINSFDHYNANNNFNSKGELLGEGGERNEDEEDYHKNSSRHNSKSKRSSLSSPSIASCSSKAVSGAVSPLTKRSSSYVKAPTMSPINNSSSGNSSKNDQTIDFYSFADMINNEDNEENEFSSGGNDSTSQYRKSSYTTMSVKDYIGVL